jgi:hypothetical protein
VTTTSGHGRAGMFSGQRLQTDDERVQSGCSVTRRLVAFQRMTAWLSDYRLWAVLLLAVGIYICAKGLDRLSDSVQAFHEDYRKVNHLDDLDEV